MKIEFIFEKERGNYEVKIDGKHFGTINADRHDYNESVGQHYFYRENMLAFVISENSRFYDMEVDQ